MTETPHEAGLMNADGRPQLSFAGLLGVLGGERGYWTFRSDDDLIEYYWHLSSTIRSIERLDDGQ